MNYEKLGKLIVDYIKVHPIDKSETYYDEDASRQEGSNDVKEYIVKFIKECEDDIPRKIIRCATCKTPMIGNPLTCPYWDEISRRCEKG